LEFDKENKGNMQSIIFNKIPELIKGNITLPTSKSMSNRLLILKHIHHSDIQISGLSDADDTVLLERLLSAEGSNFNTKNAGTVFRFLTACFAVQSKKSIITGDERMKSRPIGALVDSLRSLGTDIHYIEKAGFPPVEIKSGITKNGEVSVNATESSQFATALMLIATIIKGGLDIRFIGKPVSFKYIELTAGILNQLGFYCEFNQSRAKVKNAELEAKEYEVEKDWSSAAFFYLLTALSNNAEIILQNLKLESLQGDKIVANIFERFGIESIQQKQGIKITKKERIKPEKLDLDCSDFPDLVPVLAVLCSATKTPFRFAGVNHLVYKESNRLQALQTELNKIKAETEIDKDVFFSKGFSNAKFGKLVIETYKDHRMAMAFAPLALLYPDIIIKDFEVVKKSFPDFWKELEKLDFKFTII
jgi:3-phosphoshikimate 1-carboxyvinyltransferase